MLRSLRFQTKILLLPGSAAVAFLVVIALNVSIGARNRELLDEIQTSYFPAHESAQDMAWALRETQRALQDAAAAKDKDKIQEAKQHRDEFLRALSAEKTNPEVKALFSTHEASFGRYWDVALRVATQMVSNDSPELDQADLEALQSSFVSLRDDLDRLSNQLRKETEAHFGFARETSGLTTTVNVVTAFVCLIVLMLMSLWIVRSVIGTLTEVSSFVSAASAEILAIAKQTESNATDEAAFITETQRAMEGLVAAAGEIQSGAGHVFEQAEQSAGASQTVADRITQLNAQAQKITDISDVIRGIADKSDMLALNAALEGSKAGEAGRGISLVGAEMRRLTETVTGAVRQIKELANDIRELSRSAVMATEVGQKLASQTAQTTKGITLVTSQQRSATAQVTESMREIQQFAQQAKMGAEQARATAADLVRSAAQMNGLLLGGQRDKPGTDKHVKSVTRIA